MLLCSLLILFFDPVKTSGGAGLHFPHAGDGRRTASLHFLHASDSHRLWFIKLVADLAGIFGRTTSFGVAVVIVHGLWIPLISPWRFIWTVWCHWCKRLERERERFVYRLLFEREREGGWEREGGRFVYRLLFEEITWNWTFIRELQKNQNSGSNKTAGRPLLPRNAAFWNRIMLFLIYK